MIGHNFNKKTWFKFGIGFIVFFLVFINIITYREIQNSYNSKNWVVHTHQTLGLANEILLNLKDTENMFRGYVLVKDLDLLKNYDRNVNLIQNNYKELYSLTMDNQIQTHNLEQLEPNLNKQIAVYDKMMSKLKENKISDLTKLIQENLAASNQIEQQMKIVEEEEYNLLERRQEISQNEIAKTNTIRIIIGSINIIILISLLYFLNGKNEALTMRERESNLINELNEGFQLCSNLEEAANLCAIFGNKIFPGKKGALYLTTPSRIDLELFSKWPNEFTPSAHVISHDCWALRKGRVHVYDIHDTSLPCSHYEVASEDLIHICIPLVAQGEALGLLYFEFYRKHNNSKILNNKLIPLLNQVAQVMTLAIVNLQLRATLHIQALHDPLTGLYNRRYLEDAIVKELTFSKRRKVSFVVMMLDLDHFKEFNDLNGHQAGDIVLKDVSLYISKFARQYDTVCRYGGEEFLIILNETNLEDAVKRAEELRVDISNMTMYNGKNKLQVPTISIGIACFPEHGDTSEKLIKAADNALYQAKREGRNKVVIAQALED